MSAMVMDVRPVRHREVLGAPAGAAGGAHPRGRGFQVLSRMARVRAEDSAEYSPRHRRDVDVDVRAPFAS